MGTGDSQTTPDDEWDWIDERQADAAFAASRKSRRYTASGDHRERPVPCGARRVSSCERMTWNIRAVCDECWDADETMGG